MANSTHIQTTSDSNFQADISAHTVALVDFWAEWCGPCRMLAPTLDSIADEYAGKVKILKMNVDQNQETPSKFSIRGIPTMIIFKDGQPVEQLVGNQPKNVIETTLKKYTS
jgi:thioredoxin 1